MIVEAEPSCLPASQNPVGIGSPMAMEPFMMVNVEKVRRDLLFNHGG
jgi:hypothetical protein